VNFYYAGVFVSGDRSRRAPDHAYRVTALHAGLDELQAIMSDSLPDKSRVSVMAAGTGLHTIVTACATMKVDHHRLSTIVHSVLDNEL
jgi:hypothetical protein